MVWLGSPGPPVALVDERVALHVSPVPPQWPATEIGSQSLVCCIVAGDQLGADALLEWALGAACGTGADFVYADERRFDLATGAPGGWFKPDWAPELLLATDYIGRAWCASATLIRAAALTPTMLFDHGNYDAVLRLTELAGEIRHVPALLYERAEPEAAPMLERRALESALSRRGVAAAVAPGRVAGTWRLDYPLVGAPLVSVIIPTCAAGPHRAPHITRVVDMLRQRTLYHALEIIVVDNIPADQADWKAWLRDHADYVIDLPGPFNWSIFNNRAAAAARGAYVLFLNDDIEATDPNWLHAMLAMAQRPDVGVVGPLLLYPNGTVQHAGMFLSATHALHAFRFQPGDAPGPFGLLQTPREVTAVTGACLLVRAAVFAAVGGFEAAHAIINNDVDFCLRVGQAGWRIVFTPHATLTHHELASRAALPDQFDTVQFADSWRTRFLRGDPFFNPNLTTEAEQFLPEAEPIESVYAGPPLMAAAQVRRILVMQLNDIPHVLPALHRLRSYFPDAVITLLATTAAPLAVPFVDDVMSFAFLESPSSPLDEVGLEVLGAELTRRNFDIAVDFDRQSDSRPLLRHSGARLLAGFEVAGRFPWLDLAIDLAGDIRLLRKRTHEAEDMVRLADALGNACCGANPMLAAARWPADTAPLSAVLEASSAPPEFLRRRLICIHVGAAGALHAWPASAYAGLIDVLIEGHGVRVLMLGDADDVPAVDAVCAQVQHRQGVFSLAGRVAVGDLGDIVAACALYIGNHHDSTHMAASLGVPTIAIHSGQTDAVENGPLGPRAVAIRRRVSCSPCYLTHARDCPRALTCLRGIRVQDVYRMARLMLEFSPPV
jgi:GT2 family glycosyltransferase/ADP-heptose:LPS heptosyltransferase